MKNFRFEPVINIGNLIQAIIVIGGLIAGYVQIQERAKATDTLIRLQAQTLNEVREAQQVMSKNFGILTAIVKERTHGDIHY